MSRLSTALTVLLTLTTAVFAEPLVNTNWADRGGDGSDDNPDSRLDLAFVAGVADDMRDIATGHVIPDEGYCDQPYVVITQDGNWLCMLTTAGAMKEPPTRTSYRRSVPIRAAPGRSWWNWSRSTARRRSTRCRSLRDSGRVYVFYDYNGDDFKCPGRSDCVGWFVYKYSDDHGRTWSQGTLPVAHADDGG